MTVAVDAERIEGRRDWGDAMTIMGVFKCDYCKRFNIGWLANTQLPHHHMTYSAWFEHMDDYLHWVPQIGVGKSFPDVPNHIAEAASEAHECQSIGAYRSAVLLGRSVIEATAKEKGITAGNLYQKIEQLAAQNFIRDHVKDEAHEIRHLGNDMAHGDFVEPVSSDDAEAVLLLMGEVLNEVFQGPAVAAKLRERRESRKEPSS
jgi:hypothetical protein